MSEPIFREKSLQKVKSPDNLNEYIHVANPGIWTIMVAIIFLLLGFCIWSVFGTINTVVKADAHCEEGIITCYLTDDDVQKLRLGLPAEVGTYTGTVTEIVAQDGTKSFCIITSDDTVPDGIYEAVITVESIHPADFLTN